MTNNTMFQFTVPTIKQAKGTRGNNNNQLEEWNVIIQNYSNPQKDIFKVLRILTREEPPRFYVVKYTNLRRYK